jgi:hypothetical protein
MTPKEKAVELILDYLHLVDNKELAIKCAIMCAMEILQTCVESIIDFWQEVLTHLKEML